jgi:hypothetical protein
LYSTIKKQEAGWCVTHQTSNKQTVESSAEYTTKISPPSFLFDENRRRRRRKKKWWRKRRAREEGRPALHFIAL